MIGHRDKVLCIAPDPTGHWLLSGSSDCTLRKWEISTGRCTRVWHFTKEVKSVAWCPRPGSNVVSVCVGAAVVLICSDDSGQYPTVHHHDSHLYDVENTEQMTLNWGERNGMMFVSHSAAVIKVVWHRKGCDLQLGFLFAPHALPVLQLQRLFCIHCFRWKTCYGSSALEEKLSANFP